MLHFGIKIPKLTTIMGFYYNQSTKKALTATFPEQCKKKKEKLSEPKKQADYAPSHSIIKCNKKDKAVFHITMFHI